MPEGVECLILAEEIQRWCASIDGDSTGQVRLGLSSDFARALGKYSPLPLESFNDVFGDVEYKRISTFGKNIFMPSAGDKCFVIQLGLTGELAYEPDQFVRAEIFSPTFVGNAKICLNDKRKFSNLLLMCHNRGPRNLMRALRNASDWR